MDETIREELSVTNIETTVCFFRDLFKTLEAIPDEDAGILMKALFAHANGLEPDLKDSVIAKALYIGLADQVDRLDNFRKSKTRSKKEQNGANGSKSPHSATPYPYPNPYPNIYTGVQRNAKVQKAMGFSTERTDVDYNEIARRIREEREAAE